MAFKALFWGSLILVIYTYCGYPLLMVILSRIRYRPVKKGEYLQKVSLIVSVYNEEKDIEEKIKNCLSFDYPKDNFEIIFGSDGSIDDTASILKKYENKGIKILNFRERVGKTKVQNEAAKIASGEILFFSDATAIHQADVIKKIVRNFSDKSVGCVTGKVVFVSDENSLIEKGAGLRLRYELALREKQAIVYSLFGATGCIYAVRKELYEPLREDLVSDFVEPLKILEKGYRTVYEPEAIAVINRKIELGKEFARRARIIQQGLFGLFSMRHLLNPFKFGFLSLSLISHRLMRWIMPIILIILFLSNMLLSGDKLYLFFMIGQVVFYAVGIIGLLFEEQSKRLQLLSPLVYFCMINLAAAVGLYRFSIGKKAIYWETLR